MRIPSAIAARCLRPPPFVQPPPLNPSSAAGGAPGAHGFVAPADRYVDRALKDPVRKSDNVLDTRPTCAQKRRRRVRRPRSQALRSRFGQPGEPARAPPCALTRRRGQNTARAWLFCHPRRVHPVSAMSAPPTDAEYNATCGAVEHVPRPPLAVLEVERPYFVQFSWFLFVSYVRRRREARALTRCRAASASLS